MKNKKFFLDFLAITANLYLLLALAVGWAVKNFTENKLLTKSEESQMNDHYDLTFTKVNTNFYLGTVALAFIPTAIITFIATIKSGSSNKRKGKQFLTKDNKIALLVSKIFSFFFNNLLDWSPLIAEKLGSVAITAGKATWKYVAKAITSEYPWEAAWYNHEPKKPEKKKKASMNIPETHNNVEDFSPISVMLIFLCVCCFFAPLAFLEKLVNHPIKDHAPMVDTSSADNYSSKDLTP